jgi:hypothetical protein
MIGMRSLIIIMILITSCSLISTIRIKKISTKIILISIINLLKKIHKNHTSNKFLLKKIMMIYKTKFIKKFRKNKILKSSNLKK